MKDPQVIVFGGTSEGRRIAEFLAERGVRTLLFVATEYGRGLIAPRETLRVERGRLTSAEMRARILDAGCPPVVDATHPYAREATQNIRAACGEAGAGYLRLIRESWPEDAEICAVADMDAAARVLEEQGGKALLTVGSRRLGAFRSVSGWKDRLWARVLPTEPVLRHCARLGFDGAHLICMQGPFTAELNAAMIRALGVQWLVTKDSGSAGGFPEKLAAVRETGIRMLLVRRPQEEEGRSYPAMLEYLAARFPAEAPRAAAPLRGGAYFPLFVRIEGMPALIVGGGAVAERRARVLLSFGARVTVVSPEARPGIRELAERGGLIWKKRGYNPDDLAGMELAVAATGSSIINKQLVREAKERRIPLSVASDRALGSFWFPALAQGGGLVAGITSESGDHRTVREAAIKIREVLHGREDTQDRQQGERTRGGAGGDRDEGHPRI